MRMRKTKEGTILQWLSTPSFFSPILGPKPEMMAARGSTHAHQCHFRGEFNHLKKFRELELDWSCGMAATDNLVFRLHGFTVTRKKGQDPDQDWAFAAIFERLDLPLNKWHRGHGLALWPTQHLVWPSDCLGHLGRGQAKVALQYWEMEQQCHRLTTIRCKFQISNNRAGGKQVGVKSKPTTDPKKAGTAAIRCSTAGSWKTIGIHVCGHPTCTSSSLVQDPMYR